MVRDREKNKTKTMLVLLVIRDFHCLKRLQLKYYRFSLKFKKKWQLKIIDLLKKGVTI